MCNASGGYKKTLTPEDFMPQQRPKGNPDKEAFIAFIREGARIQREEMEAKRGKV